MSSQNDAAFYTPENLAIMDALTGVKSLVPGTIVHGSHRDIATYYEIVTRDSKFVTIRKIKFLEIPEYAPISYGPERRARVQVFNGEEWFYGNSREMVFPRVHPSFQTIREYYDAKSFEIQCPDCKDLHRIHGHAVSKSEWDLREKLSQEQPLQS